MRQLKEFAAEDLDALSEDCRGIEAQLARPTANPLAKADLQRTLVCLDAARRQFERARRPEDIEVLTNALGDGRHALESAQARLAGREPPSQRAPCFFDPRHGTSVRDVDWTPDGSTPRPIPVCAADAARLERGQEPQARCVNVKGHAMPYWDAPGYYGPWAGGYFNAFGGGVVFPGALFSGWLGSGLGWEAISDPKMDHRGHDGGAGDYGTASGYVPPGTFGG
jgi:hypothetical protein